MVIAIRKSEIFNEVSKRSALEGANIPERYDNVWANPKMGEVLDSFWAEGCSAVVQLMKRYIKSDTVEHGLSKYDSDEVFTITAEMPERYSSLLDGNIATDAKMMVACAVLHGWMEVTLPEKAAKYDEESNGYAEDMRAKLLYRVEPEKETVSARSDSDTISDGESSLTTSRADGEAMTKGEEYLSEAREDDIPMCCCNDGLMYPENNDIPLEQGWDKCHDNIECKCEECFCS